AAAAPARPAHPQQHWDGFYAADAYWGLALVHAAMGRPHEAREAFGRARDGYRALEHHLLVGAATLYELTWVVLPYGADDPAERRRLALEAEQALALAGGGRVALPPRLAHLPVLFLEGDWAEARRLALAERATGGAISWWRPLFTGVLASL